MVVRPPPICRPQTTNPDADGLRQSSSRLACICALPLCRAPRTTCNSSKIWVTSECEPICWKAGVCRPGDQPHSAQLSDVWAHTSTGWSSLRLEAKSSERFRKSGWRCICPTVGRLHLGAVASLPRWGAPGPLCAKPSSAWAPRPLPPFSALATLRSPPGPTRVRQSLAVLPLTSSI